MNQFTKSSIKIKKTKHLYTGVIVKLQHKMGSQTFKLGLLSFFTAILVLSFASALTLSGASNDISLSQKATQLTLSSSSSDPNMDVSFTVGDIISGPNLVTFLPVSDISLNTGQSKQITLEADSISLGFNFGKYQTTLTATAKNASDPSQVLSTTTATINYVKSFCNSGAVGGNLSLNNVDISSSGDDDEDWKALDEITIEVDVKNDGNDDVDDVFVELAMFDSSGRNVVNDFDF